MSEEGAKDWFERMLDDISKDPALLKGSSLLGLEEAGSLVRALRSLAEQYWSEEVLSVLSRPERPRSGLV